MIYSGSMDVHSIRNHLRSNRQAVEAAVWTSGLGLMALADPTREALLEVCLLKLAGFTWCPGCGLGHAVGFLARGEIAAAMASHPLVIPVVAVLLVRIVTLVAGNRTPN